MSLNSPCQDFVTWWIGGACPPAWNGPLLPIGKRGVTKPGPWLTHGLQASALALGAGTEVLFLILQGDCIGGSKLEKPFM